MDRLPSSMDAPSGRNNIMPNVLESSRKALYIFLNSPPPQGTYSSFHWEYKNSRPAGVSWEKAETLLEVLVSVAVIMIILAPAAALYIGSTRDTAMNRNDLAAQALAEEGIELARNIRDSNLLRFSSKADLCWDTLPGHTDLADCENNKIADGSYKIAVGLIDFGWIFEKLPDSMSDNLDLGTDEEYRLLLDPDTHIYHYSAADLNSAATPFYREIKVAAVNLAGTDFLKVTSSVRYRRAGSIRSIIRSSILTPP